MKIDNKLIYKVIMYLLLFLCAACISINLTIYGAQSVQEIQDSQLISVNNECNYSGDNNNNSRIHKITSNILNRVNAKYKPTVIFFTAVTSSIIIVYIQVSESYIDGYDYCSKIFKRSLIAQKIRLNN